MRLIAPPANDGCIQMEDTGIPITAVMSVSRRGLNCDAIVQALSKCGIDADGTKNITMRDGRQEDGCRIVMDVESKESISKAWSAIKRPFGLNCAHLNLSASYQGCIYDFLRPSFCPGQEPPPHPTL